MMRRQTVPGAASPLDSLLACERERRRKVVREKTMRRLSWCVVIGGMLGIGVGVGLSQERPPFMTRLPMHSCRLTVQSRPGSSRPARATSRNCLAKTTPYPTTSESHRSSPAEELPAQSEPAADADLPDNRAGERQGGTRRIPESFRPAVAPCRGNRQYRHQRRVRKIARRRHDERNRPGRRSADCSSRS